MSHISPHGHAQLLGLYDYQHTFCLKPCCYSLCQLFCKTLLQLGTMGQDLHSLAELAKASHHAIMSLVHHRDFPEEWH